MVIYVMVVAFIMVMVVYVMMLMITIVVVTCIMMVLMGAGHGGTCSSQSVHYHRLELQLPSTHLQLAEFSDQSLRFNAGIDQSSQCHITAYPEENVQICYPHP